MTPPDFSVLLLAWDDADPQVAVLGGSALPPTLPLVYQLAAQHPVVALYPHLPADETPVPVPAEALPEPPVTPTTSTPETAEATASAAPADALATTVAQPGVQLLPAPGATADATPASTPHLSRIVGLSDLAPTVTPITVATPATLAAARAIATASAPKSSPARSVTSMPAAPGHSQWPTGINAPVSASQWQAPAAPYLGAGLGAFFPPPPPAPPRLAGLKKPNSTPTINATAETTQPDALDIAAAAPAATAILLTNAPQHRQTLLAGDLNFDPDPELPAITIQEPLLFDEPTEEVGAGEANDISAPEDDLVPDALAEQPAPAEAPDTPTAAVAPQMPQLEGLNFRMIQYARQAAQLVHHRQDFGVIYAPNWPAWLAALEIRNSSRQPLVLYLTSLATDFAGPAERGWLPELERMTVRRATLVLVPDATVQRRLRTLYGEATGEIRIVAADDEAAVQRVLGEIAL
jgi:hypothetical protein